MVLLITPAKAQKKLAENVRLRRLDLQLTQLGLSERAGVPLPTLRKFEQKHTISLEGFLKLQMALGNLEKIIAATEIKPEQFSSIDEVLRDEKVTRKRGRRNS